jgi:hypothetical protein
LIPPWAKGDSPIEAKEIDCSEDDEEALLILQNIAQLNFKAVPKRVSYDILFPLAGSIDQYQCIRIISPWDKIPDSERKTREQGVWAGRLAHYRLGLWTR